VETPPAGSRLRERGGSEPVSNDSIFRMALATPSSGGALGVYKFALRGERGPLCRPRGWDATRNDTEGEESLSKNKVRKI